MTNATSLKAVEEEKKRIHNRVFQVGKPDNSLNIGDWKETIDANFPHYRFAAEVGLSVAAQILLNDVRNPFALVLVDVPSAGKTITINFFSDIPGISYSTDVFSPASFVSNSSNVKRKDLEKIDLLPRIRHKLFLIRDLAPIFGQRDDDLLKSLGVLTRVLDGEGLQTDTGVHGQRGYTGDYLFNVLAGSTPMNPRVWKLMGNLGSRLFFLNLNSPDKSDDDLVAQIKRGPYKESERMCRDATSDFINTLWHEHSNGIEWNKNDDNPELIKVIIHCARLLAKLRGTINVWEERAESGTRYNFTSPTIEKPDRILTCLYNLARGHAVIHGRSKLEAEDLKPPLALARDSAPPARAKLFKKLVQHGGTMTTSQVEEELNCSKPTALKEMKALSILGVVQMMGDPETEVGRPEAEIMVEDDFRWFVTSTHTGENALLNTGDDKIDKASRVNKANLTVHTGVNPNFEQDLREVFSQNIKTSDL